MNHSEAPAVSSQHEFRFTAQHFERVRRMIYQHAGISLSDNKKEMVYSRLARRLRALQVDDFDAYLARLDDPKSPEWEAFTNALTTNLTAFFREAHHFPLLAEHVRSIKPARQVDIWCSASSTGEEPYSIAMTMVETFGRFDCPVRIVASDVDTQVLARASQGVYDDERIERLDPERVRRFFLRGTGENAGRVRVRPELQRLVTFRRVNLLEASWPVQGPFDVIFCRNVMIYFDRPTQHRILRRFAPLMRPDGLLFAGHSESLLHAADVFRLRGKTVYQLASAGGRSAASGHDRSGAAG